VPRFLAEKGYCPPRKFTVWIKAPKLWHFAGGRCPAGIFKCRLYTMDYPADMFDFCVMLETIEHLERPEVCYSAFTKF